MSTYWLASGEDLVDYGLMTTEDLDRDRDWGRWSSYVMTDSPDGPVSIGEDGGEPEDQTLHRNYSWVVPALNEAYERGRLDAH